MNLTAIRGSHVAIKKQVHVTLLQQNKKKGRVRSGTHYEMVRTETVNTVQTSDALQNNRAGGRRPGLDYFSTLVDDVELVRKRGPV